MVKCTRETLRAPPLRFPAERAFPPLILMMRPHPSLLEEGDYSLGEPERSHVLDVEVPLQYLLVHRLDGADGLRRAAGEGSAVHQNMQSAQQGSRLFDAPVYLLRVCHVEDERVCLPAGGVSYLLGRSFQFIVRSRDHHHVGALSRQFHGNGFADSPSPTGHQRFLVCYSQIHSSNSFLVSSLSMRRAALTSMRPSHSIGPNIPEEELHDYSSGQRRFEL